jgi:hypothetical protein
LKDTRTPRNAKNLVTRAVDGNQLQVWVPMTGPISCGAPEVLYRLGPAAAPAVQALIEAANSVDYNAASGA